MTTMTGSVCWVCGCDLGWDKPSGLCSGRCLDLGQRGWWVSAAVCSSAGGAAVRFVDELYGRAAVALTWVGGDGTRFVAGGRRWRVLRGDEAGKGPGWRVTACGPA